MPLMRINNLARGAPLGALVRVLHQCERRAGLGAEGDVVALRRALRRSAVPLHLVWNEAAPAFLATDMDAHYVIWKRENRRL